MNAILRELLEHDWADHDYVDSHAVGFAELEKMLKGYTVERAAEVCGVPA